MERIHHMPDVTISIIIPVYNVSKYLRRCLDSCVNQTMSDIEIIVVNDCSPDPLDSEIMREYEEKYPNKITCIWHSENKKLGEARNTGIQAAKGEYLMFVDSDDYVDLRICERLYNKAKESNADYVYCDYCKEDKDSCRHIDRFTELDIHCESNRHFIGMAWGGVVKRELFVEKELRFAKGVLHGPEDVPMTILLLILSRKCAKLPESLYYYCVNPASSIQSSKMHERVPHVYEAFAQTRQCCKKILPSSDLFLFDLKTVIWLFDVLFIFYGYLHKSNIDMFKGYLHKSNIDMFKGYLHKSNIDMLKIIASIKHVHRRKKIKLLWGLISQSFTGEQLTSKLLIFDVAYIKGILGKYKHVVVWGAGQRGIRFCAYLREAKIAFDVTDASVILGDAKGFDVKPWDVLKEQADVIIVTPNIKFDEIKAQVGDEIPIFGMEEILF